MHRFISRLPYVVAVVVALALGASAAARATVASYTGNLDGPSESPPNASPGTGSTVVDYDNVAHTLHVHVTFSGLLGTTTASHIHAPTTLAGTGTASIATTTPTFAGFPLGVTSGSYDNTLDLTQLSSYNSSFVTANGGTAAGAEAALIADIAADKAYLNVHTNVVPSGEIRAFLVPVATPTDHTSWGRVKTMYMSDAIELSNEVIPGLSAVASGMGGDSRASCCH